ncbi:MAG: outer membrane beta-barrel protein [Thiobacillaceae bacterium]|nr:outer membrane beta-barrel protein [Thiobacillaceae bacterium]
MRLKTFGTLCATCALLAPVPAMAEDAAIHPKLGARIYLDVGGYTPSVDTSLRVDRAGGSGTVLDLEDDLDFEDRPTFPYALLNLRLGQRWRIEGEYFSIERDKTTVIDRELEIGDSVFPIDATVNSFFDTDVYRLSVGYSFLKRPNAEVGAALGAHVTTFDLGISAIGSGGNIDTTEAADTLAPLPTIGLYGFYAFSPRWLMLGRVDYFALEYQEYSGGLLNLNVGLEFQLAKHVGLGAGYRYVDLEFTAERTLSVGDFSDDFSGEFEYHYSGPTVYLSFSY